MSNCRVLIIDDNYDLASVLGLILESENYNADIVYNGENGESLFHSNKYNLVLIDVKLPDANGIELAYKFHLHDPDCRIIIMTGFRIEQLISQVMEDGEVTILHKPFTTQQLLNRLNLTENEHIILSLHPDIDHGESLKQQLTAHSINCLLIKNIADLNKMNIESTPDVIISDLGMPVIGSINLYIHLKQQYQLTRPFIIILPYNRETQSTTNILQDLDSTGCLFKPFDPEIILTVLEEITSTNKIKSGSQ